MYIHISLIAPFQILNEVNLFCHKFDPGLLSCHDNSTKSKWSVYFDVIQQNVFPQKTVC